MKITGLCHRVASVAVIVAMCVSAAGCGDSGSSSGTAQAIGGISRDVPAPTAAGTQIQGSPSTTAVVGQAYSFQPVVTSKAASLKFSITNAPSWARFDPYTGKLSGTPTASQVGTYNSISISVADATGTSKLPAFNIMVTDASAVSNVTLSWQAPTENADGSPLVDLKGYRLHWGSSSKSYSQSVKVSNPGLTTYVVENLVAGKYYFAITAFNSTGHESSLSPEVSAMVN